MILYIIGNGFDRAHDMPTDYRRDLRPILKELDIYKFDFIDHLYFHHDEQLWSEFEKHIGYVDPKSLQILIDQYTDQIQEFYEEHSDPFAFSTDLYGDDYKEVDDAIYDIGQYKINDFELKYDNLKEFVDQGFKQMVDKANAMLSSGKIKKLQKFISLISNSNLYINFNYTNTLEELYKINIKNILHIHGSLDEGEIIYGNSKKRISVLKGKNFQNIDFSDPYEDDADNIPDYPSNLQDYYETRKFDENKIQELEDELAGELNEEDDDFRKDLAVKKIKTFLNSKSEKIDSIIILGHSIGEVDRQYFEMINEILPNVSWKISYYQKDDPVLNNYKSLSFHQKVVPFEF